MPGKRTDPVAKNIAGIDLNFDFLYERKHKPIPLTSWIRTALFSAIWSFSLNFIWEWAVQAFSRIPAVTPMVPMPQINLDILNKLIIELNF